MGEKRLVIDENGWWKRKTKEKKSGVKMQ